MKAYFTARCIALDSSAIGELTQGRATPYCCWVSLLADAISFELARACSRLECWLDDTEQARELFNDLKLTTECARNMFGVLRIS